MKFEQLVEVAGDEPLFDTGLLLAGDVDPREMRRQMSRWTKAGRLYQLRRGLYTVALPFRKVAPDPFLVANRLMHGSYVSCQSALAYHGLIPEYVPVVTSVANARPAHWDTPLGRYEFRHVKAELLWGYRLIDLGHSQRAFVAAPEKALLDLIHLEPRADRPDYLRELRLQHLDRLDPDELRRQADRADSPKLRRAARFVADLARSEALEYETL